MTIFQSIAQLANFRGIMSKSAMLYILNFSHKWNRQRSKNRCNNEDKAARVNQQAGKGIKGKNHDHFGRSNEESEKLTEENDFIEKGRRIGYRRRSHNQRRKPEQVWTQRVQERKIVEVERENQFGALEDTIYGQ